MSTKYICWRAAFFRIIFFLFPTEKVLLIICKTIGNEQPHQRARSLVRERSQTPGRQGKTKARVSALSSSSCLVSPTSQSFFICVKGLKTMAVDSVFCADKEKLTRALLWRRQRRGWLQFQRPFEQQFRQSPAVVWNTGPPSGLMTPSPRLWRCSLRLRNCNVIQKTKKKNKMRKNIYTFNGKKKKKQSILRLKTWVAPHNGHPPHYLLSHS